MLVSLPRPQPGQPPQSPSCPTHRSLMGGKQRVLAQARGWSHLCPHAGRGDVRPPHDLRWVPASCSGVPSVHPGHLCPRGAALLHARWPSFPAVCSGCCPRGGVASTQTPRGNPEQSQKKPRCDLLPAKPTATNIFQILELFSSLLAFPAKPRT